MHHGAGDRGPSVDLDSFVSTLKGNRELAARMVHLFQEECHKHLDEVRHSLECRDLSTGYTAAHRLKGNLGMLRALKGTELANCLEHACMESAAEDAWRFFRDLERELENVQAELDRFVEASG